MRALPPEEHRLRIERHKLFIKGLKSVTLPLFAYYFGMMVGSVKKRDRTVEPTLEERVDEWLDSVRSEVLENKPSAHVHLLIDIGGRYHHLREMDLATVGAADVARWMFRIADAAASARGSRSSSRFVLSTSATGVSYFDIPNLVLTLAADGEVAGADEPVVH